VITRKNGGVEIKLLKPRWDDWRRLTYEDNKRITYFFSNRELDQIALSSGDRVMRALEAALMCSCIELYGLHLRARGGGEMFYYIAPRVNDYHRVKNYSDVKIGLATYHDKAENAPNFIRTLGTGRVGVRFVQDINNKTVRILPDHAYSVISIDRGIVTVSEPNRPKQIIKLSQKDCPDVFSHFSYSQIRLGK
jgi:hypothetical protein